MDEAKDDFAAALVEMFVLRPARDVAQELGENSGRTPDAGWQQEIIAFALSGLIQASQRHADLAGLTDALVVAGAAAIRTLGGVRSERPKEWLVARLAEYAIARPMSEQEYSAFLRAALSNVTGAACMDICGQFLLGSVHSMGIELITSGRVRELQRTYEVLGHEQWLLATAQ